MYGQLYLKLAKIVPKAAYGPHFCYTSPQTILSISCVETRLNTGSLSDAPIQFTPTSFLRQAPVMSAWLIFLLMLMQILYCLHIAYLIQLFTPIGWTGKLQLRRYNSRVAVFNLPDPVIEDRRRGKAFFSCAILHSPLFIISKSNDRRSYDFDCRSIEWAIVFPIGNAYFASAIAHPY